MPVARPLRASVKHVAVDVRISRRIARAWHRAVACAAAVTAVSFALAHARQALGAATTGAAESQSAAVASSAAGAMEARCRHGRLPSFALRGSGARYSREGELSGSDYARGEASSRVERSRGSADRERRISEEAGSVSARPPQR